MQEISLVFASGTGARTVFVFFFFLHHRKWQSNPAPRNRPLPPPHPTPTPDGGYSRSVPSAHQTCRPVSVSGTGCWPVVSDPVQINIKRVGGGLSRVLHWSGRWLTAIPGPSGGQYCDTGCVCVLCLAGVILFRGEWL